MNNRQRGDYFERRCRRSLEAHGWLVVRSAGSLGIADLVALRAGSKPLLVSCKLNGRIDPGERAALCDAAELAGARPLVALRPKAGWIELRLVQVGGTHPVPVDTLRVVTVQTAAVGL